MLPLPLEPGALETCWRERPGTCPSIILPFRKLTKCKELALFPQYVTTLVPSSPLLLSLASCIRLVSRVASIVLFLTLFLFTLASPTNQPPPWSTSQHQTKQLDQRLGGDCNENLLLSYHARHTDRETYHILQNIAPENYETTLQQQSTRQRRRRRRPTRNRLGCIALILSWRKQDTYRIDPTATTFSLPTQPNIRLYEIP